MRMLDIFAAMKYTPKLVNLTKKQIAILKVIGKRRGIPVSYLIRQAIDRLTLEDVLGIESPQVTSLRKSEETK